MIPAFCFQPPVVSRRTFSREVTLRDYDIAEIPSMNRDQLLRARLDVRNEITLLRSEQNNGGPDRTERIHAEQEKLHAITERLEPHQAVASASAAAPQQQPRRSTGYSYGFRP